MYFLYSVIFSVFTDLARDVNPRPLDHESPPRYNQSTRAPAILSEDGRLKTISSLA